MLVVVLSLRLLRCDLILGWAESDGVEHFSMTDENVDQLPRFGLLAAWAELEDYPAFFLA